MRAPPFRPPNHRLQRRPLSGRIPQSNKRNDPNKRIDSDRRSNLASFRCMTICSKNRKERPILLQSTAPASRLSTQASGRMRRSHRRRRCRRKVLRPCRSRSSGDTKNHLPNGRGIDRCDCRQIDATAQPNRCSPRRPAAARDPNRSGLRRHPLEPRFDQPFARAVTVRRARRSRRSRL